MFAAPLGPRLAFAKRAKFACGCRRRLVRCGRRFFAPLTARSRSGTYPFQRCRSVGFGGAARVPN